MDDDVVVEVVNDKSALIPTGIWDTFETLIILGMIFLAGVIYFLRKKKVSSRS